MTTSQQSRPGNINFALQQDQPFLPLELILHVVSFADHTSLITLMRVSQSVHEHAGSILSKNIEITRKNVESIFLGLPESIRNEKNQDSPNTNSSNGAGATSDTPTQAWPAILLDSEGEDSPENPSHIPTALFENYPSEQSANRKVALFKDTQNLKITIEYLLT